jgi:hypothetical protein
VQEKFFAKTIPVATPEWTSAHIQQPPFIFPIMVPFTVLKVQDSQLVFDALLALVGLLATVRLAFIVGKSPAFIALWCLAIFSSYPAMLTFLEGQFSFLLLAVFCVYAWSFIKKRDVTGGITLALAVIKPQYLLFWLIPPLLAKRWRMLIAFGVALGFLSVLAAITVGWKNVLFYPFDLFAIELSVKTGTHCFICLTGPLYLCLPKITCTSVGLLLMLIGLVVYARQCRDIDEQKTVSQQLWLLILGTVTALVLSPHALLYDALLLAPLALLLPTSKQEVRLRIFSVMVVLLPLLEWFGVMLTGLNESYIASTIGFTIPNAIIFALMMSTKEQSYGSKTMV